MSVWLTCGLAAHRALLASSEADQALSDVDILGRSAKYSDGHSLKAAQEEPTNYSFGAPLELALHFHCKCNCCMDEGDSHPAVSRLCSAAQQPAQSPPQPDLAHR
eukprot:CAMPEP_0170583002 /NCGR_PEP_ID=MMETSP0224-20130122/7893_1 /TAXON_ID=285029 /ORGANISM="Togula jolla, Strain CCCM 725" /LENGTH=104 /DNA_ID=CAMNT_0010906281 /DNA_START=203 /DNA_END=514 /DNA_ORIENTATION=+